ncbi:hypothetical protein K505DRAFT_76080 [Melanomma pulvis-pyrius CBS 109.77]|uniref:Uncharacterized protein n=1 Tax=Melanomma pulvis-pyrius CBS 109.77 TaxID=1314802 RepID=A0A6A6XUD9_9PLEO|nr:hypothetical protein K505DRAFT_76080 [Melanomma pulvis-pyrius CBS 109.77]
MRWVLLSRLASSLTGGESFALANHKSSSSLLSWSLGCCREMWIGTWLVIRKEKKKKTSRLPDYSPLSSPLSTPLSSRTGCTVDVSSKPVFLESMVLRQWWSVNHVSVCSPPRSSTGESQRSTRARGIDENAARAVSTGSPISSGAIPT